MEDLFAIIMRDHMDKVLHNISHSPTPSQHCATQQTLKFRCHLKDGLNCSFTPSYPNKPIYLDQIPMAIGLHQLA